MVSREDRESERGAGISTKTTLILDHLSTRIEKQGPLRFDEYMDFVLYEPGLGYYQTHVPSKDADFATSPSVSPWFGRFVARWIDTVWADLGRPEKFLVAEIGPGNGALARAALDSFSKEIGAALTWAFVEPFSGPREIQGHVVPEAVIVQKLEELGKFEGIILANEVLDNFPVRLFELGPEGLSEVHVDVVGGSLVERLVPIASAPSSASSHLQEGDRFELCEHLESWIERASQCLLRGQLLLIDYGDVEPEIWSARPSGTLVTYRKARLGVDPLHHPGESDITAHVNFSHLARAVERSAFGSCTLMSQRKWLKELGIDRVADELRLRSATAEPAEALELLGERGRLGLLSAADGLGDLKVFRAVKMPSDSRHLTEL